MDDEAINNMTEDELLQAASRAVDEEYRAVQAAREPAEANDVARLIATGDRLLHVQQARLIRTQADYERTRAERLSWYRGQMQEIADRAEYELLKLDRKHDEDCRQLAIVLNKLKAMRAA